MTGSNTLLFRMNTFHKKMCVVIHNKQRISNKMQSLSEWNMAVNTSWLGELSFCLLERLNDSFIQLQSEDWK